MIRAVRPEEPGVNRTDMADGAPSSGQGNAVIDGRNIGPESFLPGQQRHTCATLWLAAGMSLDDVKRALGHASIQVTSDTYGHLVADRQRQLADALDEAVG